jgi:hypothetical protein
MLSHFSFQCPFNQQLGELFEQAVLTDQIFWLFVVGQQAVSQLEQLGIGLRPLGAFGYGHQNSLRLAVSCLMTVYTKLKTPSQDSAFAISSDTLVCAASTQLACQG